MNLLGKRPMVQNSQRKSHTKSFEAEEIWNETSSCRIFMKVCFERKYGVCKRQGREL